MAAAGVPRSRALRDPETWQGRTPEGCVEAAERAGELLDSIADGTSGLALEPGERCCLDVSGLSLSEIPEAIGDCPELENLLCGDNFLATLPDALGKCGALNTLDVAKNALVCLPNGIRRCQKLDYLGIDDNMFASLPEWLDELSSLRILNCSNNILADFPSSLGACPSLEILFCGGNPPLMTSKRWGPLMDIDEIVEGHFKRRQVTILRILRSDSLARFRRVKTAGPPVGGGPRR